MNAIPSSSSRNPFDLPELRRRLSLFVTLKDAISCALVSKAWAVDFMSVIWFKVDFDIHPYFADLSPHTVAKHGHLIRIVNNAKKPGQIAVLANAGVNNLRDIHIAQAASALQHVQAYEIVFRNSPCVKSVHLSAPFLATARDSLPYYVSAPALLPSPRMAPPRPSMLNILKLSQLCLTRDSLVTILLGCPMLTELRLLHTELVGTPTQSFEHTGVKILASALKSLFQPPSTVPSLLSYFPRLTCLFAFNFDASLDIPPSRQKEDLLRYCPDVTQYRVTDHAGAIVSEFLLNVVNKPTEFMFSYRYISMDVITGMLLHQLTLETVELLHDQGFDYEEEAIPPILDQFRQFGRSMQLIPRGCSQLRTLNLHSHEMDMDDVEMDKWTCKELKTLRIRVKGLDTKEKILKTIALWRKGCWRRWQEQAGTSIGEEGKLDEIDMSIEARVARHLLKFDKLWEVWLGYQTWTPC
ncbi:hypothetical protein BGW39_007699 [Mortierella sp. 14UC]|nr:hypothetical protein BGW39_007699 [Mortierella sp. 14UC]